MFDRESEEYLANDPDPPSAPPRFPSLTASRYAVCTRSLSALMSREDSPNRKQEAHLSRFANAALRVAQGVARALEQEARLELLGGQLVVHGPDAAAMVEGRHAQAGVAVTVGYLHPPP